ncbi:hypothetical protein GCM10008965_16880 [Methylorubrum aminovorans]
MVTFACVSAASFTVPPLIASVAPTSIVDVFFCLAETRCSCEASVEVRVAELVTFVTSAASPAVSIRPASRIVAAVSASTDSLAVPMLVSPRVTVVELLTVIATDEPPITASWLTTTPILAALLTVGSLPVTGRSGVTTAPSVKATPSRALIWAALATVRLLSPAPPWNVTASDPARASRFLFRLILSSPSPPSKVKPRLPVSARSAVSKTMLSAPAPPETVKDGPGGSVARRNVSLPLPSRTPSFVDGAVKAIGAKVAAVLSASVDRCRR